MSTSLRIFNFSKGVDRRLVVVCGYLLACARLTGSLAAQSGAGSIQGTVNDASGSAIPHCPVHVVNQATTAANDTVTNSSGFYSVPGLFAGDYTITFSAPGMKAYQTTIPLQDVKNAVLNPSLAVGAVTQQV